MAWLIGSRRNTKMGAAPLFEGCPLSFSFIWRIKNFENSDISSAEHTLDEEKIQISFTRPGDAPEFTLKLKVKNQKQFWNTLVFIPVNDSEPRYIQEGSVSNSGGDISHTVWKTDSDAFLKEKNEFVVNGVLTFVVILRNAALWNRIGKGFMRDRCTQTSSEKDDMMDLDNLRQDLCKLLDNGSNSDVVLKSGNQTCHAHKGVLSARSEELDDSFRREMKESEEGVICIENADSSNLQQFLRYLYSGKMDVLCEESAKSIYVVADKYKVEFLKKKCSTFLVYNLSDENALNILVLAHTHHDSILKSSAVQFLVQREDIFISEEWDEFVKQHPLLALEVYKVYHNRL